VTNSQTVLIAGATGNVGGGAAVALARHDAHVVLLGRKQVTLDAKADWIRAALAQDGLEHSGAAIDTLVVDLADMGSVRHAAADALNRFPAINGLILSAVALVQNGPNILPNGHELMFATNVMGPFLLTQLLLERLERSDGLVLHVVAPFHERIDWDDLESIKKHKTGEAYNRTKTMNRAIAAELARRCAGKVSSVAFNPTFIIDKADKELQNRWPEGFMGLFWRAMASLFAKRPAVAGGPIADLMLSHEDLHGINGALFKLDKQRTPDKAMTDRELGTRLWNELVLITGLAPDSTRDVGH